MKKLVFTAFFFSTILFVNAQQVIEHPRYGISSSPYIELTKVELTEQATILSFHVDIPQNNWVAIHERSYIQPVGDTSRLYVIKAEGAAIATRMQWEKGKREEISYRLFFPPLSKEVTRIDFGEPVGNSWNFYDIEIRERAGKSPVPPELTGHWFSEDDGHWTFSLLDSLAVFAGQTWKYEKVTPSDDGYVFSLRNKEDASILFCRMEEKNSCVMRAGNDRPARFSKDVQQLSKITDKELFDVTSLNPGKVAYSGMIRGFSTRLGKQTGIIRYINRLSNQQETFVIPIQCDGSFFVEFPLDFPQELTVSLPSGSERIFFEPGKPLFHLANSGIKAAPSLFAGESAAINYGLYETREVATPMMTFVDGIMDMTDREYIDYVLKTREKELEELRKIWKKGPVSAKAHQIRLLDIDYRAASNALRFNGNINLAKIYANRQLNEEDKKVMGPVDFDVLLLQKFRDTPLDNELAFISNEYFSLLQSLTYTDLKRQQSAYYYHLVALGQQLEQDGVPLTGEENDMLEYLRSNLIKNYDQEESRNFNQVYREVVQKFIQKYREEMLELSNRFYRENLETNLAAMGRKAEGLPLELFEVQRYISRLKNDPQEPDEDAYRQVREAVQNIRMKESIMAAYFQKKAEFNVQEGKAIQGEETEGDRLFQSLISRYKGKVIYVDFWATWCGPCMAGIERIKPLKEELAEKDIVFLYITNPTSPEGEYKKRIPDIKGEHIRVSNDEWNYLTAKFNIFGIPHYALVDKTGRIVNAHLMHMENDELKKRLMEQLEK